MFKDKTVFVVGAGASAECYAYRVGTDGKDQKELHVLH